MENKYARCLQCGLIILSNRMGRKFCNKLCCNNWHYNNNDKYKTRIKKQVSIWRIKNPERYKELQKKAMTNYINSGGFNNSIKKNYYNNKKKWKCRKATRNIINNINYINLKKYCKKCGSEKRLEIHHEIYPETEEEISKSIKDGKIYYLCINCHRGLK